MKYQEFQILAGKHSDEILVQKIPIQNVFDQNVFICQPIFNFFCCTFCDNLNAQLC